MKTTNLMKMLIVAIFTIFTMVSCSHSPKFSEDPELISWIYRNSLGVDGYQGHVKDFAHKIMNGYIIIDGIEEVNIDLGKNFGIYYDEPKNFSEACMHFWLFFAYPMDNSTTTLEYILPNLKDNDMFRKYIVGENFWWKDINEGNHSFLKVITILQRDPLKANMLVNRLIDSYIGYMNDYAQDMVKVINWDYEANSQGDSYNGYLVTYELGTGYYVLVHLIEFEDRWNAEIKYQGNSISDLTECYE